MGSPIPATAPTPAALAKASSTPTPARNVVYALAGVSVAPYGMPRFANASSTPAEAANERRLLTGVSAGAAVASVLVSGITLAIGLILLSLNPAQTRIDGH